MAFSTEEEETLETLKRWWNESGKSLALGVVVFAVGPTTKTVIKLFILTNCERRGFFIMEGTAGLIVSAGLFQLHTTVNDVDHIATG